MKQLWVLLLLGCVFSVHAELGFGEMSPCTHGMPAVELLMQYRGCPEPSPFDIMNQVMQSIGNNLTVDNLDYLMTNYCSSVLPRMMQCFEGNVQNCLQDQRDSLMKVAQETGFICEANTSNVHPVIRHMLTQLTDADLADNRDCDREVKIDVHEYCLNRSLAAIDLSHSNFSYLESLSMEELAPMIQTFVNVAVECIVTKVRDNLDSCPQWRGVALEYVRHMVFPTVLGNRMTYTTADMDRMFGWKSPVPTVPTAPPVPPRKNAVGRGYLSILLQ